MDGPASAYLISRGRRPPWQSTMDGERAGPAWVRPGQWGFRYATDSMAGASAVGLPAVTAIRWAWLPAWAPATRTLRMPAS